MREKKEEKEEGAMMKTEKKEEENEESGRRGRGRTFLLFHYVAIAGDIVQLGAVDWEALST